MIKLKIILIIMLGLTSFIYNLTSGDLLNLFSNTSYSTFIQAHIGYKGEDNYFGLLLDYFISIIFNINIKDIASFFKMFGG